MNTLPHRLDRTVTIQAAQDLVFRYFTDDERWAAWWGAGSTIDAKPGGRVYIRYPNGIEVSGEVLETTPPERIVFTYGFVSGKPIPPGSSRVTIHLEALGAGTRLHLRHDFADAAVRDEHLQGWRYQLSVFANVVADALHGDAASVVDAWFDAWAEPDAEKRARAFAAIAEADVRVRDRFSLIETLEDLNIHVGAAQRFMPGIRLRREGDVRHCQGTLLANWIAGAPGEKPRASGTNVFVLTPNGRIESVTGFWGPPPSA